MSEEFYKLCMSSLYKETHSTVKRNSMWMPETAFCPDFSTIRFFVWPIFMQFFWWNRGSWMAMVLQRWELHLLPSIKCFKEEQPVTKGNLEVSG